MKKRRKKPRTLADALRLLRGKRSLKEVTALSSELGYGTIHGSNLSRLERGEVSDFRLSSLVSLAAVYRVPLDYLLGFWLKDRKPAASAKRRSQKDLDPLVSAGRYGEALDLMQQMRGKTPLEKRLNRLHRIRLALLDLQLGRARGLLAEALSVVEPEEESGLPELSLLGQFYALTGCIHFAEPVLDHVEDLQRAIREHQLLSPLVDVWLAQARARLALDTRPGPVRNKRLGKALYKIQRLLKPLGRRSRLFKMEGLPLIMLEAEMRAIKAPARLDTSLEELKDLAWGRDHLEAMALVEAIKGEDALKEDDWETARRHFRRVLRDMEGLPLPLRFRTLFGLVLCAHARGDADLLELQLRLNRLGTMLGDSGLAAVNLWRSLDKDATGPGAAQALLDAFHAWQEGSFTFTFKTAGQKTEGSRFGGFLRELRGDRTVRWVAERCERVGGFPVAHTAIIRLEKGRVKDPRLSTIHALAQVYGTDLQTMADTWSMERRPQSVAKMSSYDEQMEAADRFKQTADLAKAAAAYELAEGLAATREAYTKARLERAKAYCLLRYLGASTGLFEDVARSPDLNPMARVEMLGNMVTLLSEEGLNLLLPVFQQAAARALRSVKKSHPDWDLQYSFIHWGRFVFLSRTDHEPSYADRFAEAYRLIGRITRFALNSPRLVNTFYPYVFEAHYAVLLSKAGQIGKALKRLAHAREHLQRLGAEHYATFYRVFEGQIFLRSGDLEAAEPLFAEACNQFSDQFPAFRFFAVFHLTMVRQALQRPDTPALLEELHRMWLLVGPLNPTEAEYRLYQDYLKKPGRGLWWHYCKLHYERLAG